MSDLSPGGWKEAYWTVRQDYDRKVEELARAREELNDVLDLLSRLKNKLDALAELPDKWEETSRAWYEANRFNHHNGIDWVAGYEDGWDNAGELLRRELQP